MKIKLINQTPVAFKGLKNIGYMHKSFEYPKQTEMLHLQDENDEMDNFNRKNNLTEETSELINIQFTDDFNGKHLSEYKKIMDKYPEFKNQINNQFLNFLHLSDDKQNILIVNTKPLPLKDENLKLISFIAKTLKEISNKKTQEFVVNKDYILSEDFLKGFIPYIDLNELASEDFLSIWADNYHNPLAVKAGAKDMMNRLTDAMMKYFET